MHDQLQPAFIYTVSQDNRKVGEDQKLSNTRSFGDVHLIYNRSSQIYILLQNVITSAFSQLLNAAICAVVYLQCVAIPMFMYTAIADITMCSYQVCTTHCAQCIELCIKINDFSCNEGELFALATSFFCIR